MISRFFYIENFYFSYDDGAQILKVVEAVQASLVDSDIQLSKQMFNCIALAMK